MTDRTHGPAASAAPLPIAACAVILMVAAMVVGCSDESTPTPAETDAAPATRPETLPEPLPELGIEEVQVGRGKTIEEGSWALVHSRIIGDSGVVVEDTRATGRPAEMFLPGAYLQGLSKGIMGMQPGGIRKLTIPPHLAYADDPPARSKLGPNETLHATIECLQVLHGPDINLPSGLQIVSDGQGQGSAARYGSWVSFQMLIMAGADQRVVYDSNARGGPIDIGLPAPAGIVAGRRFDPEIPWLDASLHGIRAGEFRQVVLPARKVFQGRGNFPLGINEGEAIGYEITCLSVLEGPRKEFPGGLILEDLEVGDGRFIRMGLIATYREDLKLADGTVVYSNLTETDDPSISMIPRIAPDGLNRGLTGMRAGGVRRLTVPPDLAYGNVSPRGFPMIPPNSTLIFTVHLLELNDRFPATSVPGGN